MREKDIYVITCAKCSKENRYEAYSCVGPDQRERIIDDSIMSYTCPHCGETTFLKHPLTYIDPVHHFIVQYGQDKNQFIHGVEQLRMTPLYKDYIFRYTDSWLNFKEKIMILENRDDRLIELYKIALKKELNEDIPSFFLFNKEEEKELMIALNPNGTRAYIFNRNWYDLKEQDPVINKILKYDTSLIVDKEWAERLYDYRLKVSLCEVQTKIQVRTYLIPSYDHIDIGDYVYVEENGERVLGQVMTKNYKSIFDIPDHLHFIEKTLPLETEYDQSLKEEYKDLFPVKNERKEAFLELLDNIRFYYYLEENDSNASNYVIDIDGFRLIPLYIDREEAINKKPMNTYILSDLLTDVLKMTFEKIDGYMIYDEKEPYILDSQLIDIFLSYTAHKKTQIN
ncbi:CpXC domain-containing protein [uncultured Catenibacterium sp.]|uniref:CpXC domain-containing protein n=1 Tax=uncultured Catenibacterium sp. TaxID=286142 RepID=UPI002627DCD2|nr:CpXC domain-containing protein [uncultured Catenibacterium sp.]